MPSLELRLGAARDLEAASAGLEREIPALESVLAQGRSLHTALAVRNRGAEVLAGLDVPPQVEDARRLAGTIAALHGAAHHLGAARGASSALDPLKNPPVIENTALLARRVEALRATDGSLRGAAAQHGVLAPLAAPPVPEDTAKMAVFLDEYITLQYRAARMRRWTGALRNMEPPPAVESGGALRSLLAGMCSLNDRIRAQEAALTDLEMDLRNVVDRLTERIGALGRCPTCGQAMSAEDFLDHGGCHDA